MALRMFLKSLDERSREEGCGHLGGGAAPVCALHQQRTITFKVSHSRPGEVWGLCDGYYSSQRAIIMFDGASEVTYKDVPNRHSDAVCVCVKHPHCTVC